jgi:predicted alpha/beta superfamily hydrolase
MKFLTLIVVLSLLAGCSNRVDHTSSPHIDHVAPFYSAHVMPRNIDIWLPREYESKPGQHFPVLYMHDGQNLFNHGDAALGVAWDIDRTAQRLMDKGEIRPAIIVAIWNTPKRELEYFPAQISTYVSGITATDVSAAADLADNYLKFIVYELKPYIDQRYRTLEDRANTYIAGSALGAVISLYALTEYSNVFGGVACISADWSLLFGHDSNLDQSVRHYLEDKLPMTGAHRFYFYEGAISANQYDESAQWQIDKILHEKGYIQGGDWQVKKIPGTGHNENSWQVRANSMLEFLLGPKLAQ